jgi:pimeloyl-ACP methyl ester carboxylesterase
MTRLAVLTMLVVVASAHVTTAADRPALAVAAARPSPVTVHSRSATIDGVRMFYREAGPADGPVVLLLHGFPTSSHMFRNLMPLLADRYRVIAPDYPGLGQSDSPDRRVCGYTFGRFADMVDALMGQLGAQRYAMYVMDYGAPVGYRLALKHPEPVSALIVQNGNAYDAGLREFWDPIKAYTRHRPFRARGQARHHGPAHPRLSRPRSRARTGAISGTYAVMLSHRAEVADAIAAADDTRTRQVH